MTTPESVESGIEKLYIEYLHIAAFYEAPLSAPAPCIGELAGIIARVMGTAHAGPRLASYTASASTAASPGPQWRWLDDNRWFSIDQNRVDLTSRFKEADFCAVGDDLVMLVAVRNRRGAKYRYFDFMWCAGYEKEELGPPVEYDTTLRLSVRTDYFKDESVLSKRARGFVDDIVRTLASAGPLHYLFVHTTESGEDGSGVRYDQNGTLNGSLAAQVSWELWTRLGRARRSKVRGIFWGQYLSPLHLKKLGGRESFALRYAAAFPHRARDGATALPCGEGLFLRLTNDPMNFSRWGIGVPCNDIGAWLHTRFREADLLL